MNLINFEQYLRTAYTFVDPPTIRHADELTTERQKDRELRHVGFQTGDGLIYFMHEKTPTLAISRVSSNPFFQESTLDTYYQQLLQRQGIYHPTPEELERVLAAQDTVLIDLTQIRFSRDHPEHRYFTFSTRDDDTLPSEEQKLVTRLYGPEASLSENKKMLRNDAINNLGISLFDPDHVTKHTTEGPIGALGYLFHFGLSSDFHATKYDPSTMVDRLRGMRRAEVAGNRSCSGTIG